MTDGDDRLSKRYRELAREEPSPSLDAAILAASRRGVARPSLSRRWGAPVSIAAVLVLAFGVTMQMQHEKPDVSTSPPAAAAPTMPSALPPGAAPMQAPEPEPLPRDKDVAKSEAKRGEQQPRAQAFPQLKKESAPAQERETRDELQVAPARAPSIARPVVAAPEPSPPPVMPSAPAPASSPATAAGAVVRSPAAADYNAAPASIAPSAMRAKSAASAAESRIAPAPEQELERIATLRAEGNDAEADRLLEEFRRAHPGYQIPDAMWERVKPR